MTLYRQLVDTLRQTGPIDSKASRPIYLALLHSGLKSRLVSSEEEGFAFDDELAQMVSLLRQSTLTAFDCSSGRRQEDLHGLVYSLSLFSTLQGLGGPPVSRADQSAYIHHLRRLHECLQPLTQTALETVICTS